MQTKELRINKTMRTGVILAVIAFITLIALSITFAKYAVEGTGEDSARVAKWGLDQSIPTDLNLFDGSYTTTGGKDSSITVDASDGSNVIAPGTSKESNIILANFTNNEAPEVMYHFEPSLNIANVGSGQALIAKLDALPGWHWTLGRNNETSVQYNTAAQLIDAVKAYQQADIAPNTMPITKSLKIGWIWDYDASGNSTWDASDTEIGNLIAAENLSSIVITLNLNAYQCQGCGALNDPNLSTGAPDNLSMEYGDTSTFIATTDSAGALNVTSSDNNVVSVSPSTANTANSSLSYTLTAQGTGNAQVTVSVAAAGEYKASSKTINVNVSQKEVEVPDASTGLVYNGSEQVGVAAPPSSALYTVFGDNKATNAGDYTAIASLKDKVNYVWKDKSTNDDQNIDWSIAKADQTVNFTLDQSSFYSAVSRDASTAFTPATGEGNITYTLKMTGNEANEDDSQATDLLSAIGSAITGNNSSQLNASGISIPDDSFPVLLCGEETKVGVYNFTIKASASGNNNYNPASATQDGQWTVVDAKSIVRSVGSTDVTFLPAFNGSAPGKFYKMESNNLYTVLDNSSMSSLGTAISGAGATNVYTDAKSTEDQSVTFYGTIDRSWKDTFKSPASTPGVAIEYQDSFKTAIEDADVDTVYFNYDEQGKVVGNWDAEDKSSEYKEPKLGSISYNSFYSAYSSLLSRYPQFPWSSRASDIFNAYRWQVNNSIWKTRDPDSTNAVVLSQTF